MSFLCVEKGEMKNVLTTIKGDMGGKISQQEVVSVANTMVANIFVNLALYCSSTNEAAQLVNIQCHPNEIDPPYEMGSQCQDCFQGVADAAKRSYDQQRELWSSRPPSVRGSIDSDFQSVIQDFVTCGVQKCKLCPVSNVSQNTIIRSTTSCEAFNNVQNTVSQQLMVAISQQLTNNQDMLAPLATILGASSTNQIIYNLTNRMMASITDNVVTNITNQISTNQTVTVASNDGGSLSVTGITQNTAATAIQKYLGNIGIFNSIFSQDQWTLLEALSNELRW